MHAILKALVFNILGQTHCVADHCFVQTCSGVSLVTQPLMQRWSGAFAQYFDTTSGVLAKILTSAPHFMMCIVTACVCHFLSYMYRPVMYWVVVDTQCSRAPIGP